MQFDMFRVDMFRLMNQGNPFLHQMAANRIVAWAALGRADPHARAVMLEVMQTWIKSFTAMRTMVDQVGKELLPQVLKAHQEWTEGPPPDEFCPECGQGGGAPGAGEAEASDEGDAEEDEEDNTGTNKGQHQKPMSGGSIPMRPSHVIAPGEWNDLSLRCCKLLEDEESLRVLCVYGPSLDSKGRPPLKPLLVIDGAEIYGYGLRNAYSAPSFHRPWAHPQGSSIDEMLIEDYILLLALLEPARYAPERERRVRRLVPFLRGVNIFALPNVAAGLASRLICSGWLVLDADECWSIPAKHRGELDALRLAWENVNKM